jgi:hypothetical protein
MALTQITDSEVVGTDISTSPSIKAKINLAIAQINSNETDVDTLEIEELRQRTVLAKTADYQMLITDGVITADGSGGTVDITLPDLADVTAGKPYTVICLDKTNAVKLVSSQAADKINGADNYTYVTNLDSLTVIKISSTAWIITAEVENV